MSSASLGRTEFGSRGPRVSRLAAHARVNRTAINASPKLPALKSPSAHDDTIRLKIFRHGMAVRLAWPSRSEMAGTTSPYVALTDYDRYTEQPGMRRLRLHLQLRR